MNRRDFLKRLGGAAALVTLSPLLDLASIEAAPALATIPLTGTIGGITRATYTFWRNQQVGGQVGPPLTKALMESITAADHFDFKVNPIR